jgi:hypothetical protein
MDFGVLSREERIYTTVAVLNVHVPHEPTHVAGFHFWSPNSHPASALVLCPDKPRNTEQRPCGIPSNGQTKAPLDPPLTHSAILLLPGLLTVWRPLNV